MTTMGKLYVVATPLGNLEDMTMRAVRVLGEVDLVAAEDTRHSRKLLDHFGIRARLTSYYDQVEERRAGPLVREMLDGRKVALISDAGTPCIADPGYRLVRAAAEAGVPIEVIPGPCAVTAALSIAGLPTDRFTFEGFVPAREVAREKFFAALANETRTLVFYEAPHRLAKTLAALGAAMGEREIVVCRELTKLYEETWRGTVSAVEAQVAARTSGVQGELVLIVSGATEEKPALTEDEIRDELGRLRGEGLSLKDAARRIAEEHGLARNDVYRLGVAAD
jgi:16S rRNA (cytidine1402-2'-O)-methyltransferase